MQKKNANTTKRKKKRRNTRISAVSIWIVIEVAAVILVAIAVLVKMVYGEENNGTPSYTVPAAATSDLTVDDIELPTDLMKDSPEDEEVIVGDLYVIDYPEDVMNKLANLSLDWKIDMMFVTTPEALCNKTTVTVAGDIFREAYSSNPVTGLIFRDANFTSEEAGMKMLASVRDWSRNSTDMNVLLGYRGDTTDEAALSDKGLNLYCFDPDADNAADLSGAASAVNMVPAYLVQLSDMTEEDRNGFYIAQSEDAEEIKDSLIAGRTCLYMTEGYLPVKEALIQAVNDGDIPQEAIDKAAGYAIAARAALTQMRPEEFEKIPQAPEPAKAAPKAQTKKEEKKTPEQQAAEAAAAAQKQMEDALKDLQKQAEAAAAAAAQGQ